MIFQAVSDFWRRDRFESYTLTQSTAEKINESYVGCRPQLTLLAPEIVSAILTGQQPSRLHLDKLMRRFSVNWQARNNSMLTPAEILIPQTGFRN